jgi:beta-carotene hydroxylase
MPDPIRNTVRGVPALRELGLDLSRLTRRQRFTALALPFACAGAYFACAAAGWWPAAVAALVALSFVTYGSTSHDLVHRNLGLPGRTNEVLLCVIELLALRSGHAYRAAHLHHHARFPAADDIEGAAARMTWLGALADGLTLQVRVWWWAVRRRGKERAWVLGEGVGCVALLVGSAALAAVTPVFLVYAALMVAGSWVIPLATSYVPHDADGADELSRTRAYRGVVASVVGMGHLYHLEHHLYPTVPHQNWRELALRLDPYLLHAGIRPVRIWF